jgi:hypothetical protein
MVSDDGTKLEEILVQTTSTTLSADHLSKKIKCTSYSTLLLTFQVDLTRDFLIYGLFFASKNTQDETYHRETCEEQPCLPWLVGNAYSWGGCRWKGT